MSRKRIISLILTASIVLLQFYSVIPAHAKGEAYTIFSNYASTTTFDGLAVGADIFVANTSETSTIAITEEAGNSILKITKAAGQYPWFAMYMNGTDAGAGDLTVKFDFYAYSASSKVRVNAYIGGSSKILATLDFGAVKAFAAGATGLTYSPEKWYNFEISTEKAKDSVKIRVKEAGETEWGEATVTSDGIFDGVENAALTQLRIDTQFSGAYAMGIDNYSHSIVGTTDEPNPDEPDPDEPNPDEPDPDEPNPDEPNSNSPYTPDTPMQPPTKTLYSAWNGFAETSYFEAGSIEQYVTVANETNGSDASFAPDPTNSENQVMKLHFGGSGGGSVFAMPYVATDAKGPALIKFDFYAEQESCVGIRFLWGATNIEVLRLDNGIVYRKNASPFKCNGENITYSYKTWYNIELGINWERNYMELRMRKIGETEWKSAFVGEISDFESLTSSSTLTQIRIGYHKLDTAEKDFYIDNYSHITDENVRPPYAVASVKSGFENSANLDETIEMEYTASLTANVASIAKVEVSTEGNIVETPFTLSGNANVLSLKFSDLKPATTYDIKVSDVIAAGMKADDAIYRFTTAPVYMEATKPQIVTTKITSHIKSYYEGEKPARLYAAFYKNGILKDVRVLTAYVSGREGENVEFSLEGIQIDYDSVRAYIWNDFSSQIPYCQAGGTFNGDITEPTGMTLVDSVVVDTTAKTLTLTGTVSQNSDNSITIEVLGENAVWSLENAEPGKVCVSEYDFAENDSILNYLTFFEQIDGVSGKSYKIVVKDYQRTDEPEIRVRIGNDEIYYHSPALMQTVNSATTAGELEQAVMGIEFVAEKVMIYYSMLAEEEKPVFWEEYLEFRNSQPGGVFASQIDVLENFDDFVLLTKIKLAKNVQELENIISLCAEYGLNDSNSYDLYLGRNEFVDGELGEEQKKALNDIVFVNKANYKTLSSFVEDFLDKTVLYACYQSGSKHLIKSVLTKSDRINADYLKNFNKLKTNDSLEVCAKINSNNTLYPTLEELCKAVDIAISSLKKGSGSGGGGGGGGGGSSSLSGSSLNSGESIGESAGAVSDGKKDSDTVIKESRFVDLATVVWAEEAIYSLKEKGIISGRSTTIFDPTSSVTREEFVKMIVLATNSENSGATVSFSDVDANAWYYSYVASAVKTGYIKGTGEGKFGVGSFITRQDMAVILARIANGSDIDATVCGFSDDEVISEYAKGAVRYVKEKGIMSGMGNNMFAPNANVTRAQAAKAIYEFIRRG